uniref:Chromo domain-containing protein n=1 Tax=Wuchereria bancrofti TaxID=6293 RepID=A0AAF5PLD1_WUCBA
MNIDSTKDIAVEEDVGINETDRNGRKSEDTEKDSDEDELDDDEFEVDRILNAAAIDGEVKYQIRWKGYGSDEDSWEPEWNLETARLILDEYIASHQGEVKKAQNSVLTLKKLRKRCGRQMKLQNKEYSETNKTLNIRTRRKVKMECGNIRNRNNNGSDYEEVFKKRESRYRTDLERIKIVSLSKDKQDKPLIKDLSPKKAKNAWLYDDVEDADSDASESNGRVRKSGLFICQCFLGKEKENNHLKENAAAEKKNVSMAMAEKQCESNLNEKVMILMNNKKQKGKGVTPVKVDVLEENYEPKVEFIGIIQCQDGAIKVVYTKKDEMRSHVVSVRVPLISMTVMLLGNNIYFISLCGTLSFLEGYFLKVTKQRTHSTLPTIIQI